MDNQITMAEVANKVVNNISGGVEKLSEAIEKIAPGAWETLVAYHRMNNIMIVVSCILISIVTFVVSVFLYKNRKNAQTREGEDGLVATSVVLVTISLLAFTLAILNTAEAIYPEHDAAVEIINRIR